MSLPSISGVDRRGLAEVVAWVGAILAVTSVAVAEIARGQLDPEVRGLFVGLITALVARGTKAAMDRSGAADAAATDTKAAPPTDAK